MAKNKIVKIVRSENTETGKRVWKAIEASAARAPNKIVLKINAKEQQSQSSSRFSKA